MKIDKITGKECLGGAKAPVDGRPRIILFADFLPDESDASLAASDLVVAAEAARVEVTSATFAGESFAQVSLSCRTPMYFRRARKSIARMNLPGADAVVVLTGSVLRADLQSATGFRRLKEWWRRLFLLALVLRLRPDAICVASGAAELGYLCAARLLAAPRPRGMHRPATRPVSDMLDGQLTRDLKLTKSKTQDCDRYRLLERHAALGTGMRRLTLHRLLERAAAPDQKEDLRFLAKIASGNRLRSHPTVRWLRSAALGRAAVHESPAPHRLLDKAQEPAPEASRFSLPITRYMMHLHTVLQLQREFPLGSRAQARAFLDWYRKRCFERVPAQWVPCPPETEGEGEGSGFPPGSRAERAERVVLDILGSSLSVPPGDAEMMTYLSGSPPGFAVSRLAILLAALCQISLPPTGRNRDPLQDQIRDWFDGTACRLIPSCRRFSREPAAPEKPAASLGIYGMAGGSTGLGANMLMAVGMAELLRLPFSIHDVDGIEPPRVLTPAPGVRRDMRRNMVLHHVNADRIPLQIMSPQLARRNDTVHIGFLLWELDRIPQVHRLGLEMLDEIWAPSRFVAELYAAQTSTPVHLVRKGLTDLGRLQEICAPPSRNGGRFTVMVCFDFHSSVERKNPLAAVRAFQIAFPRQSHGDCRLIVKTTPTSRGHWGDPTDQMGQIRALAAADSRIEIIETFVSQPELWRMMNAADCILSTHRAEGFGYVPAYALALARPLVTTDYGGQTDFCDGRTSYPVAAPLVAVPRGHGLYSPPGARWADVPPDAVAAALRQIYDDPLAAAGRARRGQQVMRDLYSMPAYAARCRHRLEQIGAL